MGVRGVSPFNGWRPVPPSLFIQNHCAKSGTFGFLKRTPEVLTNLPWEVRFFCGERGGDRSIGEANLRKGRQPLQWKRPCRPLLWERSCRPLQWERSCRPLQWERPCRPPSMEAAPPPPSMGAVLPPARLFQRPVGLIHGRRVSRQFCGCSCCFLIQSEMFRALLY